jgi:hypothetical protein
MALCPPTVIYLILSALSIVGPYAVHTVSVPTTLSQLLFVGLWAWLLQYLCDTGNTMIAWIVLAMPLILTLFLLAFAMEVVAMSKQ